jgi:hypothetical protein
MALQYEFPVVSTGSLYTAIDTYASTISTQPPTNTPSWPNGALNPIGAAFLIAPGSSLYSPAQYYPSASGSLNSNGWGAPLIVRYVRYNSTTNANLLAYPAPVYWTDETYTTVSGTFTEGNPAATGNLNSLAGWLLPNSTSLALTGAKSATALNGNLCFIATKGFVPGAAVVGSTAIGDALVGAAGNFVVTRTASGSAPVSSRNALALTAVTANVTSDIWINCDPTF